MLASSLIVGAGSPDRHADAWCCSAGCPIASGAGRSSSPAWLLAAATYYPLYSALGRYASPGAIQYPMAILIVAMLVAYVGMVYGPIGGVPRRVLPGAHPATPSVSVPYHIGNGWGGGLVPFITTRRLPRRTAACGSALAYPIMRAGGGVRARPVPDARDPHEHHLDRGRARGAAGRTLSARLDCMAARDARPKPAPKPPSAVRASSPCCGARRPSPSRWRCSSARSWDAGRADDDRPSDGTGVLVRHQVFILEPRTVRHPAAPGEARRVPYRGRAAYHRDLPLTSIFAAALAAFILHMTIIPGFLGSGRSVAVVGMYTLLFSALTTGAVLAGIFYKGRHPAREGRAGAGSRASHSACISHLRFPAMPRIECSTRSTSARGR